MKGVFLLYLAKVNYSDDDVIQMLSSVL
ncbi:spore protease YyaC, partial [Clostridioides difficile]|nr:spore protease YyaC [Clostridioides difficile]